MKMALKFAVMDFSALTFFNTLLGLSFLAVSRVDLVRGWGSDLAFRPTWALALSTTSSGMVITLALRFYQCFSLGPVTNWVADSEVTYLFFSFLSFFNFSR